MHYFKAYKLKRSKDNILSPTKLRPLNLWLMLIANANSILIFWSCHRGYKTPSKSVKKLVLWAYTCKTCTILERWGYTARRYSWQNSAFSTHYLYPWLFNLHRFPIFFFASSIFLSRKMTSRLLGLALIEVGSFSKLLSYSTNTPFKVKIIIFKMNFTNNVNSRNYTSQHTSSNFTIWHQGFAIELQFHWIKNSNWAPISKCHSPSLKHK